MLDDSPFSTSYQKTKIAVTDTGEGIAPEFLPHVLPFQPNAASLIRLKHELCFARAFLNRRHLLSSPLSTDLDSLFGRVFGDSRPQTSSAVPTFTPPADVTHSGDKWMVSMAIPGIDPKNVEINIVGRTLRVRGERPFEGYGDGVEPILSEISSSEGPSCAVA